MAQTANKATASNMQLYLRQIAKGINSGNTSSDAILADISTLLETLTSGASTDGGIYQGDKDAFSTDLLRLMKTDDDETAGITYLGWSTYGNTPDLDGWVIQKIVLTTDGSSEINTMSFSTGIWNDRTTLTYV